MEQENWKYFIADAKIPLDAYSYRSQRDLVEELPAGMSFEALEQKVKHKFGGPLWKLVEIEGGKVEILPTVEGTYELKGDKLKRFNSDSEYLMHGFPVRGLGNASFFMLMGNEIAPLQRQHP